MGKRKLITDGRNETDALDSPEKEALERMAQEPEKTEPGPADQVNSEKIKTKDSESTENFNVQKEFQKLYEQAIKMGLTKDDLARLKILHDISWNGSYAKVFVKYFIVFVTVVAVLSFNLLSCCLFDWPLSRETLVRTWMQLYGVDIDYEPCVIEMPQFMSEIFRPPVECSFCENMTAVKTVYNISQEEFEELHAYTGVPVVIGDGTLNWTAPAYFSFEFFKEIYKEGSQALDNQEKNCQFFPYKSSFENLREVLSMSPERARMEDGSEPWYIGWSNCDFSAANILRKHYRRPYFLPKLSESSKTDWMFMGSPGYGANMHIDHVGNPSWQAQVTGTKLWTLEPPPECYYTCVDRIEVTVQPGQIIVLDTDIWYHSTLNVGLDISITIGSEYD